VNVFKGADGLITGDQMDDAKVESLLVYLYSKMEDCETKDECLDIMRKAISAVRTNNFDRYRLEIGL